MSWIDVIVQIVLFSLTFISVIYFRQPNKQFRLEKTKEDKITIQHYSNKTSAVAHFNNGKACCRFTNKLTSIAKEKKYCKKRNVTVAKVEKEIDKEELTYQLSCYKFP
ncbi:hypothetical protein ABK040_001281 [Willaertia magna]